MEKYVIATLQISTVERDHICICGCSIKKWKGSYLDQSTEYGELSKSFIKNKGCLHTPTLPHTHMTVIFVYKQYLQNIKKEQK